MDYSHTYLKYVKQTKLYFFSENVIFL